MSPGEEVSECRRFGLIWNIALAGSLYNPVSTRLARHQRRQPPDFKDCLFQYTNSGFISPWAKMSREDTERHGTEK